MIFHDSLYLVGFIGCLVVIGFAVRARCWLLAAGYFIESVVEAQVLYLKLLRIRGIPSDDPVPLIVYLNRTLSMSAPMLITVGIVLLLHRYARLRLPNSTATQQSQ